MENKGRTVIVGDVHGMLHELRVLIDKVSLTRRDHLVLVGDIIDKGPDSPGVVSFLRGLREDGYDVTLVLGNHEDRHARYRRALSRSGGKRPKMKGIEDLERIHARLSKEDIEFLDSAVPFVQVPGGIVVHAGIVPSMVELPTLEEYASMSKGEREKFHQILRVRHVRGNIKIKITVEFSVEGFDKAGLDKAIKSGICLEDLALESRVIKTVEHEKGSFLALGSEGPEDPFWADTYDGRFGHVYFGHNPYPESPEPVLFRHATGLDLGCVFGGRLSAVILEDGKDTQAVMVEAESRDDWKFATGFWET